ncbi:MAG TPA: hypothetical protein VIH61_06855, partial [Waddliaceae bacterium]
LFNFFAHGGIKIHKPYIKSMDYHDHSSLSNLFITIRTSLVSASLFRFIESLNRASHLARGLDEETIIKPLLEGTKSICPSS